eukprot:scaffold2045_cov404-Prasinococcus_capsulatus_cf.AAC.47
MLSKQYWTHRGRLSLGYGCWTPCACLNPQCRARHVRRVSNGHRAMAGIRPGLRNSRLLIIGGTSRAFSAAVLAGCTRYCGEGPHLIDLLQGLL